MKRDSEIKILKKSFFEILVEISFSNFVEKNFELFLFETLKRKVKGKLEKSINPDDFNP